MQLIFSARPIVSLIIGLHLFQCPLEEDFKKVTIIASITYSDLGTKLTVVDKADHKYSKPLPFSALIGFASDVVSSRRVLISVTTFVGGMAAIGTGMSTTYPQLILSRFIGGSCMSK